MTSTTSEKLDVEINNIHYHNITTIENKIVF